MHCIVTVFGRNVCYTFVVIYITRQRAKSTCLLSLSFCLSIDNILYAVTHIISMV